MARNKHEKTAFDIARDELFSHIHRCGVLQATEDQQREWMDDTLQFMAERYPELGEPELKSLEDLGMRFCKPIIPHGRDNTDVTRAGDADAA